ncbi:argininosuccinate synthase [Salisediminibacterium halotolerans]|uniref:Argininosuccinate synthase n=1 Tax=Salisediminibacterium halotolerans TaxID=517425 RepID=A0A1H9RPH2_9BACI|nr:MULTISPECIES: argininosuccinate synthase [Salisediminibacterium]RLJ81033.1 argininosuccinate synthase [Actinophytocola xinjiangensis]RPE87877.1 argininosuccinate synthase [Salisediminibacterium halotolerans]TWG37926.1 argininosuccinate synthase [Salisediminibacterium halotolerans]SER74577.1 argininosuccinate synthase [Salisediminibacterium haloalkalitolerans]GEL08249.1 argininosuccinate synthase [Salisediminibacterium halotolerans]
MSKGKVVLAYSGGLDTSVCIKYLQEQYDYDVIALGLEIGEGKDLNQLKEKAYEVGASKAVIIDAKELLAKNYLMPALKANTMYEGKYPLSSALSRPLISKLLVEVAEQEGAVAVAHGCTGKGNDQVRFEVSIQALNPDLEVIAPVREWGMNREEEIAYAKEKNIEIPVNLEKPYSIDANIWGRACEAGVLENTWNEAPEEAFDWTASIADAPDEPEYVEIDFVNGEPTALNGQSMSLAELIKELNVIGGKHGIGRIDHIENRLVGIKAREVYETPAALILINAHKELEFLTLPKEVTQYKVNIDQKMTQLVYDGLWYSPIKNALEAFIDETQKDVNGKIKVKLWKGTHMVVARHSENSLYNEELATYSKGDAFDHYAAEGFIKLWGLTTKTYSEVHKKEPEAANPSK